MAGRNSKPISLHIAGGNPSHLTKAEIEKRKETEIKLGDNKLICPGYIKNNINAYSKWKEITKIYKNVDFVSSGDVGLLARYCLTHSEYLNLCENRDKFNNLHSDWIQYRDVLPEDFQESIERLLKFNMNIQLETAINKKMDMLIKMEDRLFLNPLAKVKNVPKKDAVKVDPLVDRFGNV